MNREIQNSLRLNLQFLTKLLKAIPDDAMTRQFHGLPNHAAWTLGHLTHSFKAIGGEIGVDVWLPEDWGHKFGTGSRPTDQPGDYPSKDELVVGFHHAASRVQAGLDALTTQKMSGDLPDTRFRDTFPTLGCAVVHIMCSHLAFHTGQLTCWMRAAGFDVASEMDLR